MEVFDKNDVNFYISSVGSSRMLKWAPGIKLRKVNTVNTEQLLFCLPCSGNQALDWLPDRKCVIERQAGQLSPDWLLSTGLVYSLRLMGWWLSNHLVLNLNVNCVHVSVCVCCRTVIWSVWGGWWVRRRPSQSWAAPENIPVWSIMLLAMDR